MRVSELREALKHIPGRTELLIIPQAETNEGIKLGTGIGYFDFEENELIFLGKIRVAKENED